MISGVTSVGTFAVGELPAEFDLSVPNPLSELLADLSAQRCFALIANPYDLGVGAEVPVYISSRGYATGPTDTPASTEFMERLSRPYNAEVRLDVQPELPGSAIPSFGDVEIANADGNLDSAAAMVWTGRQLDFYLGRDEIPNRPFSEFGLVFSGTTAGLTNNLDRLSLQLRGFEYLFARPFQQNLYAGSGGYEGGAELKGKVKPWYAGQVRHFEPVLVDATNRVYQLHDGIMHAVNGLWDRGVALTSDGDLANVLTWTPVSGHFVTDLSRGYLRLGNKADGALTCDFQGDKTGGVYVSAMADIFQRVLTAKLGWSTDDIDLGSFAAANTANSAVCWFGARLEELEAAAGLKQLAISAGHYFTVSRTGIVRLKQWRECSAPTIFIDANDIATGTLQRVGSPVPTWRRKLGANRYHRQQTAEELSSTLTDAVRADYGEEFRYSAPAATAANQTIYGETAPDLTITTNLDAVADATTEAARQQAFMGVPQDIYELTLTNGLFQYDIGDEVELAYSLEQPDGTFEGRYGLDFGQWFTVVGWREDAGAIGEADRISPTLWGTGLPGYLVTEAAPGLAGEPDNDFLVDESGNALSLS